MDIEIALDRVSDFSPIEPVPYDEVDIVLHGMNYTMCKTLVLLCV
jgi:hypothetical protein